MSRKKPQTRLDQKIAVLENYAKTCSLVLACKAAGIHRATHYRWIARSAKYRASWERTLRTAAEDLESQLYERARDGWTDDVYYQGQPCGKVKRFSDGVGMFLLRGMMPEKYGIQRQEISGPDKAPIQAKIEVVFVRPGEVNS